MPCPSSSPVPVPSHPPSSGGSVHSLIAPEMRLARSGMGAVDAAVDHRHLSPAPASQVPGGLGAGEENVPLGEVRAGGIRIVLVQPGIVRRIPELRAVLGMDAGDEGVVGELGPQPVDRAGTEIRSDETARDGAGRDPDVISLGNHCQPVARGVQRHTTALLRTLSVGCRQRRRPHVDQGAAGGERLMMARSPLRLRRAAGAHRHQDDGDDDERGPGHPAHGTTLGCGRSEAA